ncbi:homing endonuclease [Escherichia phage P479]|nr:homing endonuclease [Escherichia phage P479]
MAIKARFHRTYIIKVKTPKGVFWYGGKHETNVLDPYKDRYSGSGKILWNIYKKYGVKYQIRWFVGHQNREMAFEHERYLISLLNSKHGSNCINILPGGQGGGGYEWTDEMKLAQTLRLNKPETKAKMKSAQCVAQNRPERKSRQSKAMSEFYANGGNKIVSEATSKAQRTAAHWHEPLKSEIYQIWLSLGKPGGASAVVKALKGKYETTPSALKLLIY